MNPLSLEQRGQWGKTDKFFMDRQQVGGSLRLIEAERVEVRREGLG